MTSTIEGVNFLLSFAYSQRENCWYLSLADASSIDIYNGVKLTCNTPLFNKCVDPRRPGGQFLVLSGTNDTSPPGLNDLTATSGRCQLYYCTSDLVAQLIAFGNINAYLASLTTNTSVGTQSTYGQQ